MLDSCVQEQNILRRIHRKVRKKGTAQIKYEGNRNSFAPDRDVMVVILPMPEAVQ